MEHLPNGRTEWGEEVARLEERARQLEHALESRVTIEQAKGILAERYGVELPDAFDLLRRSARSHSMNLHALAAEVTASSESPAQIRETRERRARSEAR